MKVPGVFATELEPPGTPVGTAVLVPGTGYPPVAPLLFFAGQTLLQHGWRVVHHWWDPPRRWASDEDAEAWVRAEVGGALPSSGPVLVVAKSLGTWAAGLAAERSLPAVWLTPLLGAAAVVKGIADNAAPQLVVGGSADQLWDPAVAGRLDKDACRVVEVPDADHAILVPGDAVRGAQAHVEVTRSVDAWLTDSFG